MPDAMLREYYRLLERRSAHNEYSREYRFRLKMDVLHHYSSNPPVCVECGESDIRVLCIDHLNGKGAVHRKAINRTGGHGFYTWLKTNKYPSGYQVLCMNCNWKKRCEEYSLYSGVRNA